MKIWTNNILQNYVYIQEYVLRYVHTMPRGRMQHTAALPRSKSCSAYAAHAIASTWKKNFLQTFFGLPKLWNAIGELGVIFF